jgi:hypothetical protein
MPCHLPWLRPWRGHRYFLEALENSRNTGYQQPDARLSHRTFHKDLQECTIVFLLYGLLPWPSFLFVLPRKNNTGFQVCEYRNALDYHMLSELQTDPIQAVEPPVSFWQTVACLESLPDYRGYTIPFHAPM